MSGCEKRLAIFEDHALMRDGIAAWFATNSDWRVVFSAGTVDEANELIAKLEQDSTPMLNQTCCTRCLKHSGLCQY